MADPVKTVLHPFDQSRLLAAEPDPAIKRGVCAALCVYWLRELRQATTRPASVRLQLLAAQFHKIRDDQRLLARRYARGRDQGAFRDLAGELTLVGDNPLAFGDRTTVMRNALAEADVLQTLARDLESSRAAVWILRWSDRSGHAVAAFKGLETLNAMMHRKVVRLFDPNTGEWELPSWGPPEIGAAIRDMMRPYRSAVEIERIPES